LDTLYLLRLDEEVTITQFLIKPDHNFKQTILEINIWTAFEALGLYFDIAQQPDGFLSDEQKLKES
jgi:hypothetical protein